MERVDRHFAQAGSALNELRTTVDKASRRTQRLEDIEFEEAAPKAARILRAGE